MLHFLKQVKLIYFTFTFTDEWNLFYLLGNDIQNADITSELSLYNTPIYGGPIWFGGPIRGPVILQPAVAVAQPAVAEDQPADAKGQPAAAEDQPAVADDQPAILPSYGGGWPDFNVSLLM